MSNLATIANRGRPKKKAASTGSISRDEVYALSDFLERTRWSRPAYATAQRNGLVTVKAGNLVFIRGCDFHDYLGRLAAASPNAK